MYFGNNAQNGIWGADPKAIPAQLRSAWTCGISRAANGVRIVYPSRRGSGSSSQQVARVVFVQCPDPTKSVFVNEY